MLTLCYFSLQKKQIFFKKYLQSVENTILCIVSYILYKTNYQKNKQVLDRISFL
jgi:hypothetical protein